MFIKSLFASSMFILSLCVTAFSQGYEPPTPIMTNKILTDFFKTHFEYPPSALANKEEGKVVIRFSTDTEGRVIESKIQKSVSDDIDNEALRLFKMILWSPAKDYGLAVEATSDFEIPFKIKKYNRMLKSRPNVSLPPYDGPMDQSGKIYSINKVNQRPAAILPEGYDQLINYIYATISYPEAAQKLNISGNVILDFVIETDGLPSNIVVKEAVGGGCTEEAVIMAQGLRWSPGILQDTAVRTQYEMRIQFQPGINNKTKYMPSQGNTGI